MSITINDSLTKKGLLILRDFVKEVEVVRRSRGANHFVAQFVDLAAKGYLIYASVNTVSATNIVDIWVRYRNLLTAWLDAFTEEYKINLPLIELPLDYRARVSLLTLMLLTRDLTEAHRYVLDSESRAIVNTPVFNGIPLHDLVNSVYPVILWGGTPGDAATIASAISKGTFNGDKMQHAVLYVPLLAVNALAEDFMHRLANYLAGRKVAKGFRLTTTGLGQAFMKFTAFIPRYSLGIDFYRTAIAAFAAVSHVHYSVLDLAINEVLNTDIRGIVDNMLMEYSKHANSINAFNAHPDFYTQAYTRGEALRDLAAMVFSLINMRLELLTKNQELHAQLLRRYTFLMKPPNDLVKDAVKAILLTSGLV
jgi:hypothetical protein